MLGVTLAAGALASIAAVYFGSKAAMGFGRDLRGSLFRKVESFSQREVTVSGRRRWSRGTRTT